MNRLISVVIPVYNAEEYIGKCLDSVLAQTYTDFEIVVVNDCTPDGSMAIVEQYAAKDTRIRVVENAKNSGTMQTRGNGCKEAKGEFIFNLDADDTIRPNALEILMKKQIETNADIVVGGLVFHKANGSVIEYRAKMPSSMAVEDTLHALVREDVPISVCAKLIRRSLLTDNEYRYFPNMVIREDTCLIFQMVFFAKCIAYINEFVYDCADNPNSCTHVRYTILEIENIITSRRLMLDVCKPYPQLMSDLDSVVTFSLLRLYCHPVPKKEIKKLLVKYGLENYATWCHGWKVLTLRRFLSTYISALLKRVV